MGLLFGGRSVEHEVSVISARGVAAAARETGLTCVPIGVTGEGRWLSPELSSAILSSEVPRAEPAPGQDDGCRVVPDLAGGRLVCITADRAARPVELDVLFPLVHGWGGEDGRLQGLLELTGLPYVGAGVLGSAAAMDKALAKVVFQASGLPVTAWLGITEREYRSQPRPTLRRVEDALGLPVFVKPANGGSSVGVTRVDDADELPAAMDAAFECDRKLLVEVAVSAREIECAVLGNDDPQASVLGEIVPSRPFYDYAAKYLDGTSRLLIPAPLEPELAHRISDYALRAYQALDLRGFARVDFLLDRQDGRVFLNEINTLPGFTPISMFPKLWEASGMAYPELIERLVALALEHWGAEGRKRTRLEGEVSGQTSG